ncbi:lytic transglycosylase domain-containing protein [Hephaestia sp. GCM10023244]|uniref:lytic transglycosylase domain-containing protein n=1 Tax=unclassified Hephaestia TaxID=2631281 RepID=UPI00207737FF|nr:lytic transglycosylase domain-containing protein [Hephaestia sp. MAHUQ-44]MCM8732439.1 lytic transglycosylase domain-containing protein [Hephaestia sp. MAHUQ-44]
MGPLKALAGAVVVLTTPLEASTHAADVTADWRPYVAEASARFGIPVAWIERVIVAESGGRTRWQGRPTTSRAGAMGLMQLMPATWAALRVRYRLGADAYDPHDNIIAGTAYLRAMYDRFGYPGLFAAYNAGPGRYVAHLANGTPLPRETRAYLAAVTGTANADAMQSATPARDLLFAVAPASDHNANSIDRDERMPGLFVPLSSR